MDAIYGPVLYMNTSAATTLVKAGAGVVFGVVVNSHSSGTLKLWDSASTVTVSTVVNNTITFAAGPSYLDLGGVTFTNGLVAVRGGTADYTFHYR